MNDEDEDEPWKAQPKDERVIVRAASKCQLTQWSVVELLTMADETLIREFSTVAQNLLSAESPHTARNKALVLLEICDELVIRWNTRHPNDERL